MIYSNFTVGEETYKLRLTAAGIVNLESKIGKNPLDEFMRGGIPKLGFMLTVIHEAMQKYHHGLSFADVCDIYDEWIANGHAMSDLADVIYEIFVNAGIIKKAEPGETADEKETESPKG